MNTKRKRWKSLFHRFNITPFLLGFLFLAILPVFFVIGVELIQRGSSLFATGAWIFQYPKLFFLNYVLIALLHVLIFALCGSIYIAAAIGSLLFSLFSVVGYFKKKLLGEPLFPWDLLLNREGADMASLVFEKKVLLYFILILLIMAIFISLRRFLPRVKVHWIGRVLLAVVSLVLLAQISYYQPKPVDQLFQKMGVTYYVWQQQETYRKNGLFLAFALNLKSAIIKTPTHYAEQAVSTIASRETEPEKEPAAGTVKPNIIIVMSEAFWDPTQLKEVTFNTDPMPTVRKLQQDFTSGWLVSPQFGGGTANVEFEVLTGHSTTFLPPGSIAYQQYVKHPMDSLASILANQGYRSVAIHSYEGWFWNRNTVYPHLGFEKFIDISQFENPQYRGGFIADAEVSKKIIDQTKSSQKPVFIYAVTMENHGPYQANRYPDQKIRVGGHLSQSAKEILESYSQGVHDADASLKMLVDYYEKSEEPTAIVFFGDHLPILGNNYQVYHEAGYIHSANQSEWKLEELKKMHSVPFVIWSNFPQQKQRIEALSTSFLGSHLLDTLQIDRPFYTKFVKDVSLKTPVLIKGLVMDGQNKLYSQPPEKLADLLDQYWMLEYDQMFGKQYLYQTRKEKQ